MQAAPDAARTFCTELSRGAANVAGPPGALSGHATNLLHVHTPAVLRRHVQPEFAQFLSRLQQFNANGAEMSGSGFDNWNPTWSHPKPHSPIVAMGSAIVTLPRRRMRQHLSAA